MFGDSAFVWERGCPQNARITDGNTLFKCKFCICHLKKKKVRSFPQVCIFPSRDRPATTCIRMWHLQKQLHSHSNHLNEWSLDYWWRCVAGDMTTELYPWWDRSETGRLIMGHFSDGTFFLFQLPLTNLTRSLMSFVKPLCDEDTIYLCRFAVCIVV